MTRGGLECCTASPVPARLHDLFGDCLGLLGGKALTSGRYSMLCEWQQTCVVARECECPRQTHHTEQRQSGGQQPAHRALLACYQCHYGREHERRQTGQTRGQFHWSRREGPQSNRMSDHDQAASGCRHGFDHDARKQRICTRPRSSRPVPALRSCRATRLVGRVRGPAFAPITSVRLRLHSRRRAAVDDPSCGGLALATAVALR